VSTALQETSINHDKCLKHLSWNIYHGTCIKTYNQLIKYHETSINICKSLRLWVFHVPIIKTCSKAGILPRC
jgi:hypothetical protein